VPCAQLIPNSAGKFLTPSAVSIDDDGSVLVGEAAAQRRVTYPEVTATEFKRDMGSMRMYSLGKKSFTPEQLSSIILSSLKKDAEIALGEPITHAVVSVPAYFNDVQRNATVAAARLADITVTRLLNEPTAAAIAYGLASDTDDDAPSSSLVFDLGGGTFDISVVEQFDGVIEIKASTGDNFLGGQNFTDAIAASLAKKAGIDNEQWIALNSADAAFFTSAAERVKRDLSEKDKSEATVQYQGEQHTYPFTEKTLETVCEPLLERIRRPVKQALRDARIKPASLDNIVLVGGSTRMPIIRKLVARLFGRFPETSINPDEAIALGAATQAALVARDASLEEVLLTDVSPFTLGVATSTDHVTGRLVEGVFSPIIERNTLIPASREERYTTMDSNQDEIELQIYQGEHRFVKDNVPLGKLSVPIPKKDKGEVQVLVRFTYDVSGMLEVDVTVEAEDAETVKGGGKQHLTVLGNAARLDEADIAKRKAELTKLKFHPRDDLPNRALLERADRLYAEFNGQNRDYMGELMNDFVAALDTQDPSVVETARSALEALLDSIEAAL